jgi:hypothetical protein
MLRKFLEIVRSNRCLAGREIAEEYNIFIESCHEILTTTFEMHRVVSRFVPRLLTQDQRDSRVAICQEEPLDRASEDENNRRWNMCLWIQCRNENAALTMGWKKFT